MSSNTTNTPEQNNTIIIHYADGSTFRVSPNVRQFLRSSNLEPDEHVSFLTFYQTAQQIGTIAANNTEVPRAYRLWRMTQHSAPAAPGRPRNAESNASTPDPARSRPAGLEGARLSINWRGPAASQGDAADVDANNTDVDDMHFFREGERQLAGLQAELDRIDAEAGQNEETEEEDEGEDDDEDWRYRYVGTARKGFFPAVQRR